MNCVAMIDDYLSPKIFSSMSKGDGHYGSRLHDPGKGVPHEAQELEQLALRLLLELVGPEDLEPVVALRGGEPLLAAFQVLEHLLDRDGLLHASSRAEPCRVVPCQPKQSHGRER